MSPLEPQGQEMNLQGSSSPRGGPGDKVTGLIKEPAGQLSPWRLSRGPGVSLSSFFLTVIGLSVNFWKYNIQ